MSKITTTIASAFGMIALLTAPNIKAQDRYGFTTFRKYDNDSKTQYLVISDPVRNWYDTSNGKMTDQEREAWHTTFKTQTNRQVGFQLMYNYEKSTPYKGLYNYFTSKAACEEAIVEEVNEFNKTYKNAPQYQEGWSGGKSYYKVIHVYPTKY
ncbi:hypothetical protein [Myroides fluvii]|uniref:hypothetical protein n=1 Tax=Myroides fluvii TaxID=2572594 RepID=UPI00131BB9BC|nr:hypothetical protein [Myroides fluvii]